MGHMLNNTIRRADSPARLQGKNACWIPVLITPLCNRGKVVARLKAGY